MNYSLTETNVFLFLILQGNEQDVLGTKEHEDKSEDEKTYEEKEEEQEEGEEDARTIQDFLGKNKYSKFKNIYRKVSETHSYKKYFELEGI